MLEIELLNSLLVTIQQCSDQCLDDIVTLIRVSRDLGHSKTLLREYLGAVSRYATARENGVVGASADRQVSVPMSLASELFTGTRMSPVPSMSSPRAPLH